MRCSQRSGKCGNQNIDWCTNLDDPQVNALHVNLFDLGETDHVEALGRSLHFVVLLSMHERLCIGDAIRESVPKKLGGKFELT